ncbi:MAG: hypothetical protein WDO06_03370 [Actinomycetota bacterium]
MKRISALGVAFALFISIATFSASSANAAATLSPKCEGVKAQILAYEEQEKPLATQYEPVNGKWSWFFATAHPEEYIALEKKIVDFQVKLFTYDKANLDCFTPDQKDYANENFKKWREIQKSLKTTPNWVAGFTFVAIVWDSIYDK